MGEVGRPSEVEENCFQNTIVYVEYFSWNLAVIGASNILFDTYWTHDGIYSC